MIARHGRLPGLRLNTLLAPEVKNVFPAYLRLLKPHVVRRSAKNDAPAVGEKTSKLFVNQSEEAEGVFTGEHKRGRGNHVDRSRVEFRKQLARGHHNVPLMGVLEHVLTGGVRHFVPGLRVAREIAYECAKARLSVALLKRRPHRLHHTFLDVGEGLLANL